MNETESTKYRSTGSLGTYEFHAMKKGMAYTLFVGPEPFHKRGS